ncbi:MarR family transcriptional regulator [Nocardioides sp. ChNu-99]|uniref:MarR family winged helix-turn-helix transcriptional regulator n=1 Tax=Nocardioides sp. ChNu-99 TaxID=2839897 RepID=UPI002406385B|nr:MarR family transcriptional regulator [Nocardioides sp. ChNu-99]MDF9716534.1 MarR family transcriptional regulator [Nocardioides sp. ChNu-99]
MSDRQVDIDAVEGIALRLEDLLTDVQVDAVVATELSIQQLKVLMLAVHRSPVTAHDVAAALGVSAATVSGLVGRLVDRGLLLQERAPHDRRARHLVATEAGHAALEQVASTGVAHRRELLQRLTDEEVAALRVGMGGLERALRELVAPGTPERRGD